MKKDDIKLYIKDNSAIFPGDAEFMYDTISKLPDVGNLLEIGTGYGHSAKFFSHLKPNWTIYTIDGFGEYGTIKQFFSHGVFDSKGYEQTKAYLSGCENVVQIIGNSKKIKWSYPVDVLFLDGDHTFEGLKADFERFSPFTNLIFFHDYDLDMEGNNVNEFIDTIKGSWNITSQKHTAKAVRI